MQIVVSGIGIISALGVGVEAHLAALAAGQSGIVDAPRLLQTTNRLPVGEVSLSNDCLHARCGLSLSSHLSRTALLGMVAAGEALRDADVAPTKRIGLVSTTSVGGMDLTEHLFPRFMACEGGGRLRDVRMHDCSASTEAIANHYHLTGYRMTISTACSSAANAFIVGRSLLRHNLCDAVVVGGTDALSAFTMNGFKSLMILDSEPCRPFDASRAGLNLGEGAAYLVLERADETSHTPYCHLAGAANSNDAHHQTASSEEGEGAYRAMSEALRQANVAPSAVDYINVHGTGTANNDLSEGRALCRLFGDNVPPFSSTKGFTGHTLAAAGAIEAVLSVLAISHQSIWPSLRFTTPIEGLRLSPVTTCRTDVTIDTVLSNSFGFGGNCASIVLKKC